MIRAKHLKSKKERNFGRTIFDMDIDFWKKLKLQSGPLKTPCWIYTHTTFKNGYGRVYKQLFRTRISKAHRYAFILINGLPEGLVCHKCDVKLCCNPSHLYDGTHVQNMRDVVKRKTAPSGTDHFRSVLTEKQVANIRMLDAHIPRIHVTLMCQLYKISKQTFFRIRRGEKYPDVSAAEFDQKLIDKYNDRLRKYANDLRDTQGARKEVSDTVWIFRHDLDRQVCFYHNKVLGHTQQATADYFACSRNAVRNALDAVRKNGLPVLTSKQYKQAARDYEKFRPEAMKSA